MEYSIENSTVFAFTMVSNVPIGMNLDVPLDDLLLIWLTSVTHHGMLTKCIIKEGNVLLKNMKPNYPILLLVQMVYVV